MEGKKGIFGSARISRRTFTAMCQIALIPAIWPAMKLLGYAVDCAVDSLQSRGGFLDRLFECRDVGVTALVTTALLRGGQDIHSPTVVKSLTYLERSVQPDGGIYAPGRQLENYESCLATICFGEANADRRYDRLLSNAKVFVKTCQWDENKGQDRSDMAYGGAGYGRERRPDLSNTAFLLDAIKSSAGPDDPGVKKALVFVSRCQNVEGADNAPFTRDGGFRYSCAADDGNLADALPDASLRSSGVMTYSGLKGLLLAGVARDDARVRAAVAWIRNHYDVKSNPGMGDAALYHYYHACAETLNILGMDVIEDAAGVKHNWRNELCTEIVGRQRKDGSWLNENGCWMEDDPHVATALALLALSCCQQPSDKTRNAK